MTTYMTKQNIIILLSFIIIVIVSVFKSKFRNYCDQMIIDEETNLINKYLFTEKETFLNNSIVKNSFSFSSYKDKNII